MSTYRRGSGGSVGSENEQGESAMSMNRMNGVVVLLAGMALVVGACGSKAEPEMPAPAGTTIHLDIDKFCTKPFFFAYLPYRVVT